MQRCALEVRLYSAAWKKLGIQLLCQTLHVSRSGYYDRLTVHQAQANQTLLAHIRAAHIKHRRAYGAFKTWRYLNSVGIGCDKHQVTRLRKEACIEAQRKRRFRLNVEYHHTPKAAPDLLQRQFKSDQPNRA